MKITAELNLLRIAPRKVRLVADAIRGKRVLEAERILRFAVRRPAHPLLKLLRSAIANARANFRIAATDPLFISEIRVDSGPTMKRIRAGAQRRVFPIAKRTSRILLVLESRQEAVRHRVKKGALAVVREPLDGGTKEELTPRRPEPRPFLEKPNVPKYPRFVQRVFRRKAI